MSCGPCLSHCCPPTYRPIAGVRVGRVCPTAAAPMPSSPSCKRNRAGAPWTAQLSAKAPRHVLASENGPQLASSANSGTSGPSVSQSCAASTGTGWRSPTMPRWAGRGGRSKTTRESEATRETTCESKERDRGKARSLHAGLREARLPFSPPAHCKCFAMLCFTVLCYFISYHIISYHIIFLHVIFLHVMLYFVVLCWRSETSLQFVHGFIHNITVY